MNAAEQQAERIIAHEGEFEILDAEWNIHTGRTMELRVVEDPDADMLANPFKKFRKENGQYLGTRFLVSLWRTEGGEQVAHELECRLKAWGEAYDRGQWVRFMLDHEADRHPLEGFTGRLKDTPGDILYAVFFELDDEDRPVPQQRRFKPSQYAHLRCTDDGMFLRYLTERVRRPEGAEPWSPELARRYVYHKCGIESLSELDRNAEARERYRRLVHEPYERWRGRS